MLTPIVGQPTHTTLRVLIRELAANARSVVTTQWGGAHGHLGLVLDDATYQARAGHPFVPLVHPGPAAVHAAGATGPQITENNRAYDMQLRHYDVEQAVRGRLRQQLINAVESLYLRHLHDPLVGLSETSVVDILHHLTTRYGHITDTEVAANRASLLTAWTPTQPIENLWNRHNEIREFAEAADLPIRDREIIADTLVLLRATRLFTLGIDAWERKDAVDQTYEAFINHFQRENERRLTNLTVAGAGYHQANAATHPSQATSTVEALAAAAARITVTPPSATHPAPPRLAVNNPFAVYGPTGRVRFYCWTHGLGPNSNHTSCTCKSRATGHVEDATLFNMQGGSTRIALQRAPAPPPLAS